MKYITKRDSETGKKFQEIHNKIKIVQEAQWELAEKHGFNALRPSPWFAWGGISSFADPIEKPDPKVWGKGTEDGEFFPKKNSKIGKAIYERIQALPTISNDELNDCIGFESDHRTIGFNVSEEYFGFTVKEKWNVKVPDDCTEVTTTYYNQLFKNVKKSESTNGMAEQTP